MGAVAPVIRALSCDACAKYVCNDAEVHSKCCDEEDACSCDATTHEVAVETPDTQEISISLPWLNIHAQT